MFRPTAAVFPRFNCYCARYYCAMGDFTPIFNRSMLSGLTDYLFDLRYGLGSNLIPFSANMTSILPFSPASNYAKFFCVKWPCWMKFSNSPATNIFTFCSLRYASAPIAPRSTIWCLFKNLLTSISLRYIVWRSWFLWLRSRDCLRRSWLTLRNREFLPS